jgi:metal-responsive CopG/Arc/MetJ family transcriptional regulator
MPKNRGAQVGQKFYRFGICVPWDLLGEIDADANRRYMDRSTWIRTAAMKMLEEQKEKKKDEKKKEK